MSYGEWCCVCGSAIVSVTRGIPSMALCANGHRTDRRDSLRYAPAAPAVTLEQARLVPEVAAVIAAYMSSVQCQKAWESRDAKDPFACFDIAEHSEAANDALLTALATLASV